jgi:hypothetical protein
MLDSLIFALVDRSPGARVQVSRLHDLFPKPVAALGIMPYSLTTRAMVR